MYFKINLLVLSCIFGFTFLGLLSYNLNRDFYCGIYIGCFISLITGVLCHGTNNKKLVDLDVCTVHIIAIFNILYYLILIENHSTLTIIILIICGLTADMHRHNRKEYIELDHLLYVHIPCFIAIFMMIIDIHKYQKSLIN